jgi:hypothetical protein
METNEYYRYPSLSAPDPCRGSPRYGDFKELKDKQVRNVKQLNDH